MNITTLPFEISRISIWKKMALANFSLPYATPTPFLYSGSNEGQSVINNIRLNAALPPQTAPIDNVKQYRNDPYNRYQQQQQQPFRYHSQSRGQEIFTGTSSRSYLPQNTRYSEYDENFKKSQLQQDQRRTHQQASFQHHYQPLQQKDQQNRQYQQHQQIYQQQSQQQNHQQNNQQNNQQQQDLHHHERQQINLQQRISFQSEKDQVTNSSDTSQDNYPERPNGYTRVNSGSFTGSGAKTTVHAVLDYDDDDDDDFDYYDDENPEIPSDAHVTPIQGPIFLKNGSVPVVPLYSYPQLNNGTLVQIPILWTALSVALGVELRGDLIKGAPCIKKNHQLFCPTAGNTYPIERIEQFIDENKALMKRMYGDFEMNEFSPPKKDPKSRRKRSSLNHDIPDGGPRDDKSNPHSGSGDSYFSKIRSPRQSFGKTHAVNESGRVDACESRVEIVTPYWSTNSAGKVRAIVNTQHFEQAIHQEVCSKSQTGRCTGDCGCEQKYKWHRLLAYDPDNDCKGIFMDWFLYPSCCVCRCDPDAKLSSTTSRN